MNNLYDLSHEVRRLALALERVEENGSNEELEALKQELIALKLSLEDKVDVYVRWLKNIESEEGVLRSEIDRLSARKKSCLRKQEFIRKAILDAMVAMGERRIKLAIATVSRTKPRESIEVDLEQCVLWEGEAEKLLEVSYKVNKSDLRNLPGYEKLPGVTITTGEEGVSIR